jgi:hypothetical protein
MANQRWIKTMRQKNGSKVRWVELKPMGWHELRRHAKGLGVAIHGLNREELEAKIKEVQANG